MCVLLTVSPRNLSDFLACGDLVMCDYFCSVFIKPYPAVHLCVCVWGSFSLCKWMYAWVREWHHPPPHSSTIFHPIHPSSQIPPSVPQSWCIITTSTWLPLHLRAIRPTLSSSCLANTLFPIATVTQPTHTHTELRHTSTFIHTATCFLLDDREKRCTRIIVL